MSRNEHIVRERERERFVRERRANELAGNKAEIARRDERTAPASVEGGAR
jgi:hypothetical protein